MIKNTLVSITDKGVKFMLLIILLAMTSCGTETVFYWNMRDVIGLSIFGFAVAVYFVLIIVEWFTNKLKLWKRKETK
jgi:cellulose synthase/poly-beta-1,6-N-acetylglucosamine synthase-like glycosyltransferase